MPEKTKTRKVLCPECESEVSVTRDEDGDDVAKCDSCGLNVGKVLTRRRYDSALHKMEEAEKAEANKGKKKSEWW